MRLLTTVAILQMTKQAGQGESGDLDALGCEVLKWLGEVVFEKLCGRVWAGFGRCNEKEHGAWKKEIQ